MRESEGERESGSKGEIGRVNWRRVGREGSRVSERWRVRRGRGRGRRRERGREREKEGRREGWREGEREREREREGESDSPSCAT